MVVNMLSVPALWTTFTLMILIMVNVTMVNGTIVNGTKALGTPTLLQQILTAVKGTATKINTIEGTVNNVDKTVNGCDESKGFFFAPVTGRSQCLKVFLDAPVPWSGAEAECKKNGLVLARPYNAIHLRRYLYERYTEEVGFWVNAKGNDTIMEWQENTCGVKTVPNDSPLWLNGQPGNLTPSYCMVLDAKPASVHKETWGAYASELCAHRKYALCQSILPVPTIRIPC